MHPTLPSRPGNASAPEAREEQVGERIEALAGWVHELDAQLRALNVSSDEKTLKELRGALEAWSKRDPKFEERLTERVEVLADRITTLSSAVNTSAAAHAGADGELANLRRELEQETAKLHSALQKRIQGSQADGETIAELRRAVAELSGERPGKRGDKAMADLRARIDYVGERVDTLAKTVATTAAGLAGREGDLAALRRSFDQADAQVAELATSVRENAERSGAEDVGRKIDTLAARVRKSEAEVGARLHSLDERLQERVKALEAKLATTAADLSGKEQELGTVRHQLEEMAHRLEASTRELREALPAEVLTATDVDERLVPLSERIETLSVQVRRSEELVGSELRSLDERLQERVESAARELREAIPSDAVGSTDVDERLAPLGDQIELLALQVRGSEELFGSRLRALDERLHERVDALDATVAAAAADLSGKDQELAAVRRGLDEVGERVDAAAREMREALPTEAVTLAEVDERLHPLAEQLEQLANRALESEARVAESIDRESSRVAEVERRLEGADRRLEKLAEAEAQLDASVRQAQAALAALDEISPEDLDGRIEPVARDVAALAARVDEAERRAADRLAEGASHAADVESLRSEVEERLDALEAGRETAVAEAAARAAAAWSEEQAWVREHLDALVQAVAETPTKTDVEEPLQDVSARLEELERERARLESELARAGAAAAAEQDALAAQVAELAARPAPIPPAEDDELRRLLLTFADRIEEMERERAAERQAARAADDEAADLRAVLAALDSRLAATEQLLASEESHDVEERVETLRARLDSLEETVNTPRAAALGPGDGRLRVDLRALELRLQHAEAAARENQEAVLSRLERLAARLEPEAIGEVVPIRGGADT